MIKFFITFFCISFSVKWTQAVVSQATVDFIKNDLKTFATGRKVAHLVRAVFHDCVGGCDGCLRRGDVFNQGCNDGTNWIETINDLDCLYVVRYECFGLSRADIYVLAAEAGIENAIDLNNQGLSTSDSDYVPYPTFNFKYGRLDCTDPTIDRTFPGGHLDWDGVFGFFNSEFGMDKKETVAIMGAGHTLGGSTGFTGWIGFWKGTEQEGNKFNNDYFRFLINPNFQYLQESVPQPLCSGVNFPNRFQWNFYQNGVQQAFGLNADVALVKNFIANSNGQSSCTYDTCPKSPGNVFVRCFAQFASEFINVFNEAWRKMATKGATNLITPA